MMSTVTTLTTIAIAMNSILTFNTCIDLQILEQVLFTV